MQEKPRGFPQRRARLPRSFFNVPRTLRAGRVAIAQQAMLLFSFLGGGEPHSSILPWTAGAFFLYAGVFFRMLKQSGCGPRKRKPRVLCRAGLQRQPEESTVPISEERVSVPGVKKLSHAELQAFLEERCREPGLVNCDMEDLDEAARCAVVLTSHGNGCGEKGLLRAKEEALFPLSGLFSAYDVAYVITVIRVSENQRMDELSAAMTGVETDIRAMAAEANGIRSFLHLVSLTEERDAAMVDIILTGESAA